MEKSLVEKQYDELLKLGDSINLGEGEELSDEELEKVMTKMQETITDPAQDFPSNKGQIYNENTDPSQNKESKVLVSANPITGVLNTIPYEETELTEEKVDEIINLKDEDINKIEIGKDAFAENVKAMYPEAKDEDIKVLLDAVNKYRAGIKFPYYNNLPDFIKFEITKYVNEGALQHQAAGTVVKQLKNNLAKELYELLIQNNYTSKVFKDLSNYTMGEINKEKEKLGASIHEYNDKLRKEFEVGFIEKAEELEVSGEEGSQEKADKLRESSRMFTQSYTYEDMYEAYKFGKIKVKSIQLDKFNRTCQEFNRKYYNNTFKIKDVGMTIGTLDRVVGKEYNITAIKKFIVAFINYTRSFSPSNIPEHVFMYYFIQNILALDIKIPNTESAEFNELVIENIHKFLNLIIEKDNQKEEMKKKGMK